LLNRHARPDRITWVDLAALALRERSGLTLRLKGRPG
jgi:hypothetical protein